MMKIVNDQTGKTVAEFYDAPKEVYVIDEKTGKKYLLEEYREKSKETDGKE